jgi:hypothetical protein
LRESSWAGDRESGLGESWVQVALVVERSGELTFAPAIAQDLFELEA